MPSSQTSSVDIITLSDENDEQERELLMCALTDVGCRRKVNEDSFVSITLDARRPLALMAVADGMGGHERGDEASQLAIRELEALFRHGKLDRSGGLNDAFLSIDRAIATKVKGGGTTLVAAMIDGSSVTIANSGDSRAYLLRGGRLSQTSVDHSWVQSQVSAGRISAEDARTHPRRNVLLRALGPGKREGADIFTYRLMSGDCLLLCSDGLHGVVDDPTIKSVLDHSMTPQNACDELIELARQAGGPDNITVVIARY